MASIEISNLYPAGSDLFLDSESFIEELNADEFDFVRGGAITTIMIGVSMWRGCNLQLGASTACAEYA